MACKTAVFVTDGQLPRFRGVMPCTLHCCPGLGTALQQLCHLMGRWQTSTTQRRAAPEVAESSSERGEEWRIDAEASPPTQGDALEARLTEQVEEGAPGGVPDDLAQHSALPHGHAQPLSPLTACSRPGRSWCSFRAACRAMDCQHDLT